MRKNKARAARGAAYRKSVRIKVIATGIVLSFLFLMITVRLVQLTVFSDQRVAKYSAKQRFRAVNLHLPRGVIYDRNFNQLAASIMLRSIYANPRRLENPKKTAARLASLLEPKKAGKRKRLSRKLARRFEKAKDKYFVWVRRKIPPETYARISAADIPGVGFVKESKRFYPKRDVAAKIIGFCGIDNQGLCGIEYRYDNVIHPVRARSIVRKDAYGRPISTPAALNVSSAAAPMDLVLTIDERIQYVTEKALERKVLESGAKGGVAIVMDPNSGEILAMAEQPKYNPNNFAQYKAGAWKSHAVSDAVEPGSTFKVFVAAAAVEEGAVSSGELIDCENGRYEVGGKAFREAMNKKYGHLSVSDIIARSSNIGAIKLAEILGPDRLRRYLSRFGFGARTGVDLPGESAGLLRPVSNWSMTSLPSISFGQEVAVTPVQMASGVSMFANGGRLVRPRLVRAFLRDGDVVSVVKTEIVRRPLSPSTAATIRDMMIRVVTSGTGKKAAVPGYTVAGKSGTAQKIDPATRTYSDDKFLSSFVGFFPAENPALVIVVMIDEPKGVVWGGAVAGPVFAEIASRAARILRIPGSEGPMYEIDWSKMFRSVSAANTDDRKESVAPEKQGVIKRLWSLVDSVRQTI